MQQPSPPQSPVPPVSAKVRHLEQILYCPVDRWHTLRQIDLSHQSLTSLPKEIGRCTGLKSLSLNDNQLRSLPTTLGFCTALEILDLSNNDLTELPVELDQCQSLKRVHLTGNPWHERPTTWIRSRSKASIDWDRLILNAPLQCHRCRVFRKRDTVLHWLSETDLGQRRVLCLDCIYEKLVPPVPPHKNA